MCGISVDVQSQADRRKRYFHIAVMLEVACRYTSNHCDEVASVTEASNSENSTPFLLSLLIFAPLLPPFP